jgi:SAM-dependent methyltransferase
MGAGRAARRVRRELGARILYGGRAVSCPCCQRRFRAFRRHPRRPGWVCPACASLERHRALCLWLAEHPDALPAGARVLHVAPEAAITLVLRRASDLRVVAGDLHPLTGQTTVDVTNLPFPDETFDLVLCSHVLEHVPDDSVAMSELRRVLRPHGVAILQQPVDAARSTTLEDASVVAAKDRRRMFGQSDHVRLYGRDVQSRLEAAGFRVELTRYPEALDELTARRHGLLREAAGGVRLDDVYACRREPMHGDRAVTLPG